MLIYGNDPQLKNSFIKYKNKMNLFLKANIKVQVIRYKIHQCIL